MTAISNMLGVLHAGVRDNGHLFNIAGKVTCLLNPLHQTPRYQVLALQIAAVAFCNRSSLQPTSFSELKLSEF